MNLEKIVEDNFAKSLRAKQDTLAKCKTSIVDAGNILLSTLENANKVLICGNGGSAADSQHFAAELVMRYETSRQSLPAISLTTDTSLLTAIPNDDKFDNIFSRQVEGLGQAGDLLFGVSTSGNSKNVLNAIKTAHNKKLKVIILTGKNGGIIREILQAGDIEICVPDTKTARIQEAHILIIHALCNMADIKFTG